MVVIEVARGMRQQEDVLTLPFGFGRGMDSEGQGDVQVRLRKSLDEIILKRMGV